MNKSDTIKELAAALCKAQAEMPAAPFNSTNPFLKNRYADLGSIIKTAQPILAKHGLSVSQMAIGSADEIGVTTILMHGSGEYLASTITMKTGEEKGKSDAQVAGSAISYLRRYSLASILGMYADEDTDVNKPEKAPAQAQSKATPANNGSNEKFPIETIAAVIKAKFAPDANYANDTLKGCVVPRDADPEIVGRWLKAYQGYIDQGETAAKATETANKGYKSWLAKQAQEQQPA